MKIKDKIQKRIRNFLGISEFEKKMKDQQRIYENVLYESFRDYLWKLEARIYEIGKKNGIEYPYSIGNPHIKKKEN